MVSSWSRSRGSKKQEGDVKEKERKYDPVHGPGTNYPRLRRYLTLLWGLVALEGLYLLPEFGSPTISGSQERGCQS